MQMSTSLDPKKKIDQKNYRPKHVAERFSTYIFFYGNKNVGRDM